MPQKPITIARRDYAQDIVNLTNNSGLPAFVMVDVLEHVLNELRPLMNTEVKRDEATWRAAMQKENEEPSEPTKENEKE